MTKEGYICLLCRYLKDLDKDEYIQFGTDQLPNRICKDCMRKFIREGNQACLE